MSNVNTKCVCGLVGAERLQQEFQHIKAEWCWLLLYGILLSICGAVAIIVPPLATVAAMIALGMALMVGGIASIILSFWAGKWSGTVVQLLIGVLYLVAGFAIFDTPVKATLTITLFIAMFFIVVGLFRMLSAMLIRFPHWGWALLNGVVTFLVGMVIYRHFPNGAPWILGLLVGIELLFHGWTWIVLALAVRDIPDKAAA